jgi:2-amino-4-hydroxy-6-hydroxymethyldihydropteridine diphosphokinase
MQSRVFTVYLSLGSNIKSRVGNLNYGIEKLNKSTQINVTNISSIYETQPLYVENQDDFLNMVIEITTTLSPDNLLQFTKHIEQESGRKLNTHNLPRTLDIDILAYDNQIINTENLVIPHPKLNERKFVLEPWAQIAPNLKLPKLNISIVRLLEITEDCSRVMLYKEKN